MRLITKRIEVEVEVDGVKVKGRSLTTSEQSALRQKSYISVTRKAVDADTGEESTDEKTVFSGSLFAKLLWVDVVIGLSDNAVNEEGVKLECNEKDLSVIFEFNEDFTTKVIKRLTARFEQIRKGELKNSTTGVTGTLPQAEQTAKSAKKKS